MARRGVVPCKGSQTPPASRNSVVLRLPRPPSPPGPRGGRGPGRGAQRPFANQKNRRAQNDLGRRPSTPQKRGAVDQGHSAATERTQALDDEPRRPARTRCSAARRSFKGQFDSQHRRRYRASRVLEPRPAPPSKRRHQRAPRDARAGPEAPPRVARRSAPTTESTARAAAQTHHRAPARPSRVCRAPRGPPQVWRRTRTTTRTRRATTGPAAPSGWTGSTPLRVRTVFFRAVMFLLHCLPPHRPLTPRVVSSLSPQLIRSCSRYTSTNARVLICEFH